MDKENPKNEQYQIILALDLTTLNFNSISTVEFFYIQSNGECGFSNYKIGPDARSWWKDYQRGYTNERWAQMGSTILDYTYSCL